MAPCHCLCSSNKRDSGQASWSTGGVPGFERDSTMLSQSFPSWWVHSWWSTWWWLANWEHCCSRPGSWHQWWQEASSMHTALSGGQKTGGQKWHIKEYWEWSCQQNGKIVQHSTLKDPEKVALPCWPECGLCLLLFLPYVQKFNVLLTKICTYCTNRSSFHWYSASSLAHQTLVQSASNSSGLVLCLHPVGISCLPLLLFLFPFNLAQSWIQCPISPHSKQDLSCCFGYPDCCTRTMILALVIILVMALLEKTWMVWHYLLASIPSCSTD